MAASLLLPVVLSACGSPQIFNRFSASDGYWLPLAVALHLDASVTDAGLSYADACRQPQILPIGDRLKETLKREIGTVFERVSLASDERTPLDGVVDIALGLKEVELFIPHQAAKSYPATVTLGLTATYVDSSGDTLYTKSLRADARGTVETTGERCEVQGLHAIAAQAAMIVSQGLKKHLGTSTKIREAAQGGRDRTHQSASSASVPNPAHTVPSLSAERAAPGADSPALSFRVMLKDANADQVLQRGEAISLELEISNTGARSLEGIVVTVSGTPSLVQQFTFQEPVGDVVPGETKRLTIQGTAPDTETEAEAELIISVSADSRTGAPAQKKFRVALEPTPPAEIAREVDVDRVPDRVPGYERHNAVGIAVGIGAFRKENVSAVQFAARDAEVMARYFETVGGIPAARIRLATDDHALKDDLVELFEEWLPEQMAHGGTAFIFLAGRGMVNPSTGGVFLVPHEADPSSASRLYSLRRLYEALARLPMQRVVLLMDLTFDESASGGRLNAKGSMRDEVPAALRKDKLVQIMGTNRLQEAHRYEAGKHGLFTYFLLKGLGGAADTDHNGFVVAGELCGYVRAQVISAAREHFRNSQEPVCILSSGSTAKLSQFAIGRVR